MTESEKQAQLIGCIPMATPGFKPEPGSLSETCCRCQGKVWLNPTLQRARNHMAGAQLICFPCVVREAGGIKAFLDQNPEIAKIAMRALFERLPEEHI